MQHPPSGGGGLVVLLLIVIMVGITTSGKRGMSQGPAAGHLTRDEAVTGSHLPRAQRDRIRRHEERHLRKIRQFGGNGYWEYTDYGGVTHVTSGTFTPVQKAAIAYAGRGGYWLRTSPKDRLDDKIGEAALKQVPRQERAAARRAAWRLAR